LVFKKKGGERGKQGINNETGTISLPEKFFVGKVNIALNKKNTIKVRVIWWDIQKGGLRTPKNPHTQKNKGG